MIDRCSRIWEAEALEDGRLEGADRDSFERHLATCADCRAELASLADMHRAMRSIEPASPSELELRRTRSAVLRDANRDTLSPRSRRAMWIAALACAVAVVVLGWHLRSRTAGAPVVAAIVAAPDYHVGGDGAAFTTRTEGPVVRVTLSDGEASFAVTHLTKEQRFVVETPDAEIEVRGTKFRVLVEGGATKRVVVEEGRVALRHAGANEAMLDAGQSWAEPVLAAADAAPPAAASSSHRVRDPGERFGRAMNAFGAGRYAEADADFAAFARAFPHDARAEDAAFLRAVSRSRLGDRAGAAALAHEYLRDYPNGLRRAEAQRLADATE